MSTPERPETAVRSKTLESAAFGANPDLDRFPAPGSTRDCWTTAVVLGGQGHYAGARAALDVLDRRTSGFSTHSDRVLASLSASTRASFLRQSGRHALAATWDGRALAIVDGLPVNAEAACDALTGLAADALGCGRLPLGWRLLGECRRRLDDDGALVVDGGLWRQEIRIEWVSAELALAGGDFTRAGRHAERAVELSGESESVRHRVKSGLLRSAALTGTDPSAAVESAVDVLAQCQQYGLLPLAWASSMLIEGVSGGRTSPSAREIGDLIAMRGGSLLPLS
ncbi:hypothetical protein ACFT1A_15935 [Rhodococcus sp. NPDC057135]|uniref:hypothetical protein n=1 Tax=Rhodococcus sp. NPDC057135 TaxID=3346028 RepID=UPI003636C291